MIMFEADSCKAIPMTKEKTVKDATAAVISMSKSVRRRRNEVNQITTFDTLDMRFVLRDNPISFRSSIVAKIFGRFRSIERVNDRAVVKMATIKMNFEVFSKYVGSSENEYLIVKYNPTKSVPI